MRVKEIKNNGNTMWADTAYIVAAPVVSCTNNVVTMTCSTSGATIRYSTDGGSSWSNYSSSITISATTTYKAYATKSGMIDSAQTSYTATYVQLKLPTPTIKADADERGRWYFTVKTAGVSGVKYYLKYETSPYASASVACSLVGTPTTSSYHATGTGTGSDSTWTYKTNYPLSYYINAKVIGTKSGYTNSDSKCAI